MSSNLLSPQINLLVIDINLVQALSIKKIVEIINPTFLFISRFLSPILKHNNGLETIYPLLYLYSTSVYNHITNKSSISSYILLQKTFTRVLVSKKYTLSIKYNVKDMFCIIFWLYIYNNYYMLFRKIIIIKKRPYHLAYVLHHLSSTYFQKFFTRPWSRVFIS